MPNVTQGPATDPKITPFLWFDGKAEEAAEFYVSIFKNAKILTADYYLRDTPGEAGSLMTVEFVLDGQRFIALNGGPAYHFTPAISFSIDCVDQAEVDWFWDRLGEGGRPVQCGWLEDKYGVSWQVVPGILPRLLVDENEAKADAVMQAMLKMVKLDVAALQAAYDAA
jgi:predicted 3-demethylubiquinone-9 3-methyltransferase (glyoxalase superfamily)